MVNQSTITDVFIKILPVCGVGFNSQKVKRAVQIQRKLNKAIDITKYGEGIRSIFFAPLAVPPDDKFHTNENRYWHDKKMLHIYQQLDWEKVNHTDSEGYNQMVVELLIQSVVNLNFEVDFDMDRFISDLKKVLL